MKKVWRYRGMATIISACETVNSEIFVRVLLKFGENKNPHELNGEITLPFTDVGKSYITREVLT